MNLILIEKKELAREQTVVLTDRRGEHIINVLRCSENDEVRVGLVNGPTGLGRILDISPGQVILKVDCTGPAPVSPPVDLILALPRPIMLKRILTQAASMGVDRIFLIKANRVEKSFFQILNPISFMDWNRPWTRLCLRCRCTNDSDRLWKISCPGS